MNWSRNDEWDLKRKYTVWQSERTKEDVGDGMGRMGVGVGVGGQIVMF